MCKSGKSVHRTRPHPTLNMIFGSSKVIIFALADAYGCKIVLNGDTTSAKPRYNNQQRQTIYSCTPGSSSTQYEIHLLSVYEVINRRPPTAGDATVNVVSGGKPDRPIILVLGSYEPVNWILNIPAGVAISKVILASTQQELKNHRDHFSNSLSGWRSKRKVKEKTR